MRNYDARRSAAMADLPRHYRLARKPANGAAGPQSTPGQPLEARVRSTMEARFGHDFSRVRVHTDARAAESAQSLDALAYTVGRDVVFAAGQYAPGTAQGQRMLAHELAHVVQQDGRAQDAPASLPVSQPGDPAEQEAERAAGQVAAAGPVPSVARGSAGPQIQRQTTTQPVAQPVAAQQAANAEPPDLRQRRLTAASRLRVSIGQFRGALSGGARWNFENISAQGNQMTVGSTPVTEPMADRQRRLTQLMNDMVRFTIVLEAGPAPANWLNPQIKMPAGSFQGVSMSGSTMTSFGSGPDWEDPLRFFANWELEHGQDAGLLAINLTYIPDPPQAARTPGIPRVAISGGVSAGIWIVVPDPDNKPLEYHRLSSHEVWNGPGEIIEVWHDDSGYYYTNKGQKHYLPERPTL